MFKFRNTLLLLIVIAFCLRLYKLTTPLADWHSFRQADTASVTREYVKHGIDLLRPKYHDLSNVQSGMQNQGKDNVEGYRMVEFPIVNGVLAMLVRIFPMLDLVIVSRMASILASLVTLICLTLLVRSVYGNTTGLLTGFIFATLPYSVFYSRTILPEPFFIACSLLSLVLFLHSMIRRNLWLGFLSALIFSLALLIKPMAIFFAPVFVAIWFIHSKKITAYEMMLACAFILSAVPLYLWRQWITQFPLGIPSSDWLYNGGGPQYALSPVYRIRFQPAWIRWIFYERLTKLFLGYFGLVFFLGGALESTRQFLSEKKSRSVFFFSWAFGALLYVSVFAAGNVQHDYYQVPLMPFVSLAVGLGILTLFTYGRKLFGVRTAQIVCILLIGGMYWLSWSRVKGYYNINNWEMIAAGKVADSLLPATAKVIAPYQGDTAFLFQVNRTGWPIGFDIETKIAEGATHYVSVNYDDEARELETEYETVEKTSTYIILDLTRPLTEK